MAWSVLGLVLIAFILYKSLRPLPSVEALIQSVNRDSDYRELRHALESRDSEERLRAVHALLALQTNDAFKLLRTAVSDQSTVIRVTIVGHLQDFPEQKAIPLIMILLDDREFGIQRDAIAVLQKITGKNYNFRFEASPEEKADIIIRCKRDINERLKINSEQKH